MADETYRDFVLDQLAPLAGALECRKMFGGCGLVGTAGGAGDDVLSRKLLAIKC
ncbi:MAG: hypothetical protein M3542_13035 [Acidobacteriota bacterium]|nr:hypothetical protein [Acidobacteriota bacterium]MDQ5871139.1 hypothetical protein [Acidobacteriota bacterium]